MLLGHMVKRAREARGYTQDQLAAAVGVTRSTIAVLEADRRVPVGDTLARIVTELALDPAAALAATLETDAYVPPELSAESDR